MKPSVSKSLQRWVILKVTYSVASLDSLLANNNKIPVCDYWLLVNNAQKQPELIAEGESHLPEVMYNSDIWVTIEQQGSWL